MDRRPLLTKLAELAGVVSVLLPLIGLVAGTEPERPDDSGDGAIAWLRDVHVGVQEWGGAQSTTVLINWTVALTLAVFAVSFIVVGMVNILIEAGEQDASYGAKIFLRMFLWVIAVSGLFLWVFWRPLPLWGVWVAALGPLVLAMVAGRIGTALLGRYLRRLS